MGKRRKSRELALQLLYQLDVQGEGSPGPHLDEFWTRHPVDVEVRDFAEALVRGTKLHEAKIDELISGYAQNWEIERMAVRHGGTFDRQRAGFGRPDRPILAEPDGTRRFVIGDHGHDGTE